MGDVNRTPGPWEVAEGHAGWLVVGDVKATSHVVIAEVPDEDEARLIASVPDLVEALQCARNFINGMPLNNDRSDALSVIDAALSKAGV